MSEAPRNPGDAHRVGAWTRAGLGLSVTPCAVALAEYLLPPVHVDPFLADVIAFAGATAFPILGLALATMAELSVGGALALAGPAALALIALAFRQPSPGATLLIVDSALVTLAWALGASLGRRVQHAAHLFPACVVAACADLVSVLSPEGPSHAIAASDRALSVLAVGFPVPGSQALAPALGVGDLLFMALVFAVARAHALPYARTVLLCLAGTALAGAAAAYLAVAVPALVLIAAAVVLGLPSIRQLQRADRTAARVAMLLASSVALATLVRGWLLKH
ncbi:MAG: hypothetical protein ABW061_26955 [Polyangiaceae bacterium]